MKYILLIGIFISFSGTNLVAQSTENSLKTKIKMVKEVKYNVENEEIKSRASLFESHSKTIRIYDKNENLLESAVYKKDGALSTRIIHEMNAKGDVQKITTIRPSRDRENIRYVKNEYDSNNNRTGVKIYDEENNLITSQTYKYDENGNNIEEHIITPKFKTNYKLVSKYDSDNQRIELFETDPTDGSISNRKTISYDQNRKTVSGIHFGDSFRKTVYEYDEMGNTIKETRFNDHGEQTDQISFEFVYDEVGNWITKKTSLNGELRWVTERQIEYYD